MKPVLRALVWLGLGGGIGFFAGWQLGYNKDKSEIEAEYGRMLTEDQQRIKEACDKKVQEEARKSEEKISTLRAQYEAAVDAVRSYQGYDEGPCTSATTFAPTVIVPEEEPEMPMDEPKMPDDVLDEDEDEEEEIPQLHPQDILPHAVSKSEFLQNEGNYDVVDLDYYTDDDVIFDPKAEEKWTHPEQLLGIGWKTLFISAKGLRDVVEIYIQNDTMETLYRITRIDDSFAELYEEE